MANWRQRAIPLALVIWVGGCSTGPTLPAASPSGPAATSQGSAPAATPVGSVLGLPSDEPSPTVPPLTGDAFGVLGIPGDHHVESISCSGSIGAFDPVAVVEGRAPDGLDHPLLMDYADPRRPREACVVNERVIQIVDPRHLLILGNDDQRGTDYAVVDVPEVRYHWFRIPVGSFGNQLLAVAPDLSVVAWNAVHEGPGSEDLIHLATATTDRVIATLPDSNEGRCDDPIDSNTGGYTRSGTALFVLDEPLPEVSLLVIKGGTTVLSLVGSAAVPMAQAIQKALWSSTSETLYYVQRGSVWRWTRATGTHVYLPGVAWSSATISPDGRHLAYDAAGADGRYAVFLVDLAGSGKPRSIGDGPRGNPAFLNDEQLFYLSDGGPQACVGGPSDSQALIYDLATSAEGPSPIDGVDRIWPGTSTDN